MNRRTLKVVVVISVGLAAIAFVAFRPDTLFFDRTVDGRLDDRVATSGSVALIRDGATSTVVFTDLSSSNGPDLVVCLSPAAVGTTTDYCEGALRLGGPNDNLGTQSYELPEDADISGFRSVAGVPSVSTE